MEIIYNPDKKLWGDLTARCCVDSPEIDRRVEAIVSDIKANGEKALRQVVERIEGFVPGKFEVDQAVITKAAEKISPELKAAIKTARRNITAFHTAQLRKEPVVVETMPGVRCEQRVLPIDRVGIYIPGGRAPLFSTVLMLAIPARIAGCREVVMCTPPRADGTISSEILYAAAVSGVDRIFAVGGAQAIAAMAYGTESVPRVDKIFGPGNRYVTRAKQIVAADCVAIDMPAGPSEVMILADRDSNPLYVAADLLSQAEHGPDSQGIALTDDVEMAEKTAAAVEMLAGKLSRKEILAESLANCRIIVVNDREEMIEFANRYAAEHLIISTADPEGIADRISAAGSIFIGAHSPESAGDYASGTNHTLPTGGWAVSMNGVNTDSFLRRVTLQTLTKEGLRSLAPAITSMAGAEGLDAHALAVTIRLQNNP